MSTKPSIAKVRVLLADDHAPILEKVRGVLGDEFEVVGAVSNGRDAITEVQRLHPDVLIIDIAMPVLNGLQATCHLVSYNVQTKIVLLTVHEDQDYVDAALHAGASGYVTKSHLTSDLVPAIREVLRGGTYVSHFPAH